MRCERRVSSEWAAPGRANRTRSDRDRRSSARGVAKRRNDERTERSIVIRWIAFLHPERSERGSGVGVSLFRGVAAWPWRLRRTESVRDGTTIVRDRMPRAKRGIETSTSEWRFLLSVGHEGNPLCDEAESGRGETQDGFSL